MHPNSARQHEQAFGFFASPSSLILGSELQLDPDEIDVSKVPGSELAPQEGGGGGKGAIPVEVFADDEDL